jgi:hypothetical protein
MTGPEKNYIGAGMQSVKDATQPAIHLIFKKLVVNCMIIYIIK